MWVIINSSIQLNWFQTLNSHYTCVSASYPFYSNILIANNQCYFLATASAATPIVYQVDRVRDGSSYVTRGVRAIQNGHTVFIMVCSFHKLEPWQPSHQWKMPDAPPPEQCENDEATLRRLVQENPNSPEAVQHFNELLIVSLEIKFLVHDLNSFRWSL